MSTGPSYRQTGNNLHHFPSRPSSLVANGGGGGDNDDMEARVTALEEAVKNLPTKADLDGMRQATKADLDGMRAEVKADFSELRAELRTDMAGMRADIAKSQADMHKAIADNHRWTHTALVSMISVAVIGILGLLVTIWNASKPQNAQTQASIAQTPAQQQPIIINVPPSAAPQQEPTPAQAQ